MPADPADSDATPRPSRRLPAAFGVLLLTAALAAVGVASIEAVRHRHPGGAGFGPAFIVLAGVVLITEGVQINIAVRRHTYVVSFSELPLVLGAFLLGPGWLFLARVAGALPIFIWQRIAALRVTFNLALYAAEVGLFTLVLRTAPNWSQVGPASWGFAYLGVLLLLVQSATTVFAAVGLYQGRHAFTELATLVPALAVSGALSTTVGLVSMLTLRRDSRSAVLLGVLGVVFVILYRFYAALANRFTGLGRLYRFSRVIATVPSTPEGERTLLDEVRNALNAEVAALVRRDPGEPDRLQEVMLDSQNALVRTERRLDETHRRVLDGSQALRLHSGDAAAKQFLTDRAVGHGLLVPVQAEGHMLGVLEVFRPSSSTTPFTADDLQVFETIAARAAAALENGRLLERLRYEARHDALTGMLNRVGFVEELEKRLSEGHAVAVLLFDIDRFQEVNDTLGHASGDVLLREVARRLRAIMPPTAVLARLGADEYGVFFPAGPAERPLDAVGLAERIARGLRRALMQPIEVAELPLDVSAAAGIAVYPVHGADAATLLLRADIANHAAKVQPDGVAVYSASLDPSSSRRLTLAAQLRRAISAGELVVFYQPKVSLHDGGLHGVEALVRWQHPKEGLVMPDEFIPIAEHTDLIGELTLAVLRLSLAQCRQWLDEGRLIGVSVNVSVRGLHGDFAARVGELLRASQVPPSLLTLEITESSVMSDLDRTLPLLRDLHRLGLSLSVDDFGTGYSSLAYLRRLPVDEVKIDKSFVLHMGTEEDDAAVCRMIVDLARNIGLRTVAEGVEDEISRDALANLGCDLVQGFLLSRPLPPDRFASWLAARAKELPEPGGGPRRVVVVP